MVEGLGLQAQSCTWHVIESADVETTSSCLTVNLHSVTAIGTATA